MRPEAHQLLGDVEPVGQKGQLLRQPRPRPPGGRRAARRPRSRSRSRSRTSRSGARAAIRSADASSRSSRCRSSAVSASPSRARIARHSAPALATTGSTSLQGTSAGSVRRRGENVGLPGHQLDRHLAAETQRDCSSRSRSATSRARSRSTVKPVSRVRATRSSGPAPTTWPRSKSRRSRSRSSPSRAVSSPGSLADRLKWRWLTVRISTRSRRPPPHPPRRRSPSCCTASRPPGSRNSLQT